MVSCRCKRLTTEWFKNHTVFHANSYVQTEYALLEEFPVIDDTFPLFPLPSLICVTYCSFNYALLFSPVLFRLYHRRRRCLTAQSPHRKCANPAPSLHSFSVQVSLSFCVFSGFIPSFAPFPLLFQRRLFSEGKKKREPVSPTSSVFTQRSIILSCKCIVWYVKRLLRHPITQEPRGTPGTSGNYAGPFTRHGTTASFDRSIDRLIDCLYAGAGISSFFRMESWRIFVVFFLSRDGIDAGSWSSSGGRSPSSRMAV